MPPPGRCCAKRSRGSAWRISMRGSGSSITRPVGPNLTGSSFFGSTTGGVAGAAVGALGAAVVVGAWGSALASPRRPPFPVPHGGGPPRLCRRSRLAHLDPRRLFAPGLHHHPPRRFFSPRLHHRRL